MISTEERALTCLTLFTPVFYKMLCPGKWTNYSLLCRFFSKSLMASYHFGAIVEIDFNLKKIPLIVKWQFYCWCIINSERLLFLIVCPVQCYQNKTFQIIYFGWNKGGMRFSVMCFSAPLTVLVFENSGINRFNY